MAKRIGIEDNMLCELIRINGVTVLQSSYMKLQNGEIVDSTEYLYTEIPMTDVEMEDGSVMHCDGILFFGDGCMEFHDAIELDAYNWCQFTDESVIKITNILENL